MPAIRKIFWVSRNGLLGLFCLLLIGAPAAEATKPIDLEGTWYVLVHYTDPKTANPDAMRWLDLVWVFEKKGTRLEWTEYPLVIFDDSRGRFEALGTNHQSRVLEAWEPNAQQRESLAKGPQVSQRGKRVKSLRGSNPSGWKTPPRRNTGGVSVMTYHENLTIEDLDGYPLFLRQDVVGNGTGGDTSAGKRYQVDAIEGKGSRLLGQYERDDRQTGRFQMRRTPPTRGVAPKNEDDKPLILPPGFTAQDFGAK